MITNEELCVNIFLGYSVLGEHKSEFVGDISFLTDNKKYENIDYYMVHNTHYGQSTTAGACTILSKL